MCRKSRPDLSARLRRSRALAVCLGDRRVYVRPLDLSVGRPPQSVLEFLKSWPLVYDPELYDDQVTDDLLDSILLDRCVALLDRVHRDFGWFEVTERARLLGTSAYIRVRQFDVLYCAPSVLEKQVGRLVARADRRVDLVRAS